MSAEQRGLLGEPALMVMLIGICYLVLAAAATLGQQVPLQSNYQPSGAVPIPLDALFDNKGFGSRPGEASLDTEGRSFPAEPVGQDGFYTSTGTGMQYRFEGYHLHGNDNLIAAGQRIAIPPSEGYRSAGLLMTTDVRSNTARGNVTLVYDDGAQTDVEVRAQSFWWFPSARRGEINFPYFYTSQGRNGNASFIYESTFAVDPSRNLTAVILPNAIDPVAGRLHVFAMSLWKQEVSHARPLNVQLVRPTQEVDSETGGQLVEVIVNHVGDICVSHVQASLASEQVKTVRPYTIRRICSGDQRRIYIPVKAISSPTDASEAATSVIVRFSTADAEWSERITTSGSFGLRPFSSAAASVSSHGTPRWFDGAKFGIFIHWGPYSVPGWGNSTPYEFYAEWFWWKSACVGDRAAADPAGFAQYRKDTFGASCNYDDFFTNYTVAKWDPKEWVDLVAEAGAEYFVFTTKHHDGFANFDTGRTSNRSSLHYGPHRDLLRELFDAAKTYQPHLKRGTYFSLPEWYSPDMAPYSFATGEGVTASTFPGMLARNPWTGEEEPYTGHIPVTDFIQDLMVPQMEMLAYEYETDIMWCDMGAFNDSDRFAAGWYNFARAHGREVTMNDRCGSSNVADFDTPEYATFSQSQARKWESNVGMDPFSYGYNRATPNEAYKKASTIVRDLVDIISKNGNYLLDIGPRADGSIVQVEADHLREAGKWITSHREAVCNTTYWFLTPQEGDLRFTHSEEGFYIFSLVKPEPGRLFISAPVPIQRGDKIVALGSERRELVWGKEAGRTWIEIDREAVERQEYCWVFKIAYQ